MIYLDTSVALAHLLVEDQSPPDRLWQETLISSRLLEYEVWTRIHARNLTRSHSDEVRSLLNRIAFIELFPPVLTRALEPFPKPVRTLDALLAEAVRQGWITPPALASPTPPPRNPVMSFRELKRQLDDDRSDR